MESPAISSSKTLFLAGLALSLALPGQTPPSRDLAEASLEELMNVQVTSVSKKEQKLSRAGAAIYVISQEDIRHSSATNIPDLLRMVPGVDVAQIDANLWAISIRGFNGQFANKVLVLIDGRTVYTPIFSGVYWDQQMVPLPNIDRIEIIRGPGGTVWGANAVNGVINIITKDARSTSGGLVSLGTGTSETARGLFRYGGSVGQNGAYRIFGDYFNISSSVLPNGARAADGWHAPHAGFRTDWKLSSRDSLTVQGDLFRTDGGQTQNSVFANALPLQRAFNDTVSGSGGNILSRWNHTLANGSDFTLQVYFDRHRYSAVGSSDAISTTDVDFNHHWTVSQRHDIVWGLGFRTADQDSSAGYSKTLIPLDRSDNLYSGFIQDEVKLFRSVWLTVGTKLEHNNFNGFEYEPSGQLVWAVNDRHTLWTSVARAVRQTSSSETGFRIDLAVFPVNSGFGVLGITTRPQRASENVLDWEVGYRAQLHSRFSLDITGFASRLRNVGTLEPLAPVPVAGPPAYLFFGLLINSGAHVHNDGGEMFATWNVTRRWKLAPGLALLRTKVFLQPGSQDSYAQSTADSAPRRQFPIRSSLALMHNLNWDTSLAYNSRLAAGSIPQYARLDTQLLWRAGESLELSLAGQNLLRQRHPEFDDSFGVFHTLVKRSVLGKITWRF